MSDEKVIGKVRNYRSADCCRVCTHRYQIDVNDTSYRPACGVTKLLTSDDALCDSFNSRKIL